MATDGMDVDVETLSTKELAYHITLLDWDQFWAIHEYELLYHTFGRHHFGKVRKLRRDSDEEFLLRNDRRGHFFPQITANLDVFIRRFNEIQYWTVTEIVSTASLGKRVSLLRKFIKLAA